MVSWRSFLLVLSLVSLGGCTPPQQGASPEPLAPGSSAAPVAISPVASASAVASWAPVAASAAPDTSAVPDTSAAPEEEFLPRVDCNTMQKTPSPGRRWLCELAQAKDPAALLDERGFALVTRFESPGDDADPEKGRMRKRACGAEAQRRLRDLYRTILFKLAQGDDTDPWLTCKGMKCELRGEGEWSTWGTLYFRKAKGRPGLALEAWTEIEVTLVMPEEVARRQRFLAQGLRDLASVSCPAAP